LNESLALKGTSSIGFSEAKIRWGGSLTRWGREKTTRYNVSAWCGKEMALTGGPQKSEREKEFQNISALRLSGMFCGAGIREAGHFDPCRAVCETVQQAP
jgi:hypothetical protein